MKRILCVAIALCLAILCFASCGTKKCELYSYPTEIPEYEDNKQLELMAYWSPPNTLEHYQYMVDCGFTSVVIDAKYGNDLNSEILMETLALCDQVGIKAYPSANRGTKANVSMDYGKYSSFAGFYTDEPLSKNDFDTIEANMKELNEAYSGGHYTYLVTLIGGAPTAYNDDFSTWEEYYNYYFDHGGRDQEAFLLDCYPLVGTSFNGVVNNGWLMVTERYAQISKDYGVPIRPFIATMSISSIKCRRPAEDDLRYQINVNLAYGAKGISYFCYMSPGIPPFDGEFKLSDYALVNYTDVNDFSTYYRTETWYSTQRINNEIKAYDHVLLSFDWQGVMKSPGTEAMTTAGENFNNAENLLTEHDGIEAYSTTEDAIIGVFRDENNYDGFMLVNFADPLLDRTNDATIQFCGATRAVVYIKGEQHIIDLEDGIYAATLEPGEAQFIIPLA